MGGGGGPDISVRTTRRTNGPDDEKGIFILPSASGYIGKDISL